MDNFYLLQINLTSVLASIFRHSYLFAAVLFLSFFPKLFWVMHPLIYLRVMTVCFSISLMVHAFGGQGILISLIFNIPQNILAIGASTYVFYKITPKSRVKYACVGTAGILCAIIYEIFAAPLLLALIL